MLNKNENYIVKKSYKKLFMFPLIIFIFGFLIISLYLFQNNSKTLNLFFSYSPIVGFVIIVLSAMTLFYKILILIFDTIENHVRDKYKTAKLVFNFGRKIFKIIYLLISVNIVIYYLNISAYYQQAFDKAIYTTIIVLISWVIIQFLNLLEEIFYTHLSETNSYTSQNIQSQFTKIQLVKRIFIFLTIVFAISIILMQFDGVRNIGISLIASAGFLTAVMGFAAQKPLTSILTGFQLAFSQPVKLNDIVIIENEFGMIEKITMGYIVVKLWDLRRIVVPTNYFFEQPFQNWSYTQTDLIGTIFIYVDFSLPLSPLREELINQLNQTTLWDKKVSTLEVTDFKETCIELRILVSANNPDNLWKLRVLIREKILEFINKNYVHAFPKRYLSLNSTKQIENKSPTQ